MQPADTTQPLGRDPAQVFLHRIDATSRAHAGRICCPSLSYCMPTQAIVLYLSCIPSPNSSSKPSRLGSGGSPSEYPPPPTQTQHSNLWQHLLSR